jgi:hypothetical protein
MTTRNRELASIIDDSGNITTGGNLSVTGNLTQTSSTTTTYSDGLLELNSGAGSNSNDLGLVMERGSTGNNAIFLWDESNDGFAVGTTTAVGSATGNISFSAAPFTASTITGTILSGSTSLRTPLIEFTDGDDALTIADGGLVTTSTHFSIGGSNNELRFYEGSNYVGFEAPALSADQIWVLPTADGSASQILKTDGSGTLSWTDDLTLANASVNNYTGNGSTTGYTMSTTPVSENGTQVYINGVYQFKNTYAVSGTTLTFDTAPANGASIEALVWSTVAINVPADSSVTNTKLNASIITGQSEVTAADADHVLIYDASGSALKKALVSDLLQTSEEIADIVGAMVSSNTESGITVAYQDADNTLDFTVGTLNQDTTGTALTVTQAAQTAITSVGTLTTLTVDNVIINGTTIGHTGDTDLMTLSSGTLDIAGTLDANNITIAAAQGSDGQVLTSTGSGVAWESLPASTIDALSDAKSGGTNFSRSLILGHQTTGTLDGANDNTAVGSAAMDAITSGTVNTAVGSTALSANTTAASNTAIGYGALATATTGGLNTAVGRSALLDLTTGTPNVAVGAYAGQSVTTGASNTFIGYQAGDATTTADGNTAVGRDSLVANTTGDQNTAVGAISLDANTTGRNIVAVGYNALGANTTGASNVAVGMNALRLNTTAANNTAVGTDALTANTTAASGTAVGKDALKANTTGGSNTAVGSASLDANTTGASNTAIGVSSLGASTTGDNNVAVGQGALELATTADNNTAVGREALTANTTGAGNVAIGFQTLDANTEASDNVAIGIYALGANTTGANNVAVGRDSLTNNTTATGNTAVGYASLLANTTGAGNTAVGLGSLDANTTATRSTAVGYDSLGVNTTGDQNTAVGAGALEANTTGHTNTAVGEQAGKSITTGDENVAIGHGALDGCTTGAGNVAIGTDAIGSGSYAGQGYNTAVGYNAMLIATSATGTTAIGNQSLDALTTGDNNTGLGAGAAGAMTTGANNIAIGKSALQGVCTGSHNVAIGTESLNAVTSGGENITIGRDAGHDITTGTQNVAIGHESLTKNVSATGNVAIGFQALENVTGATNIGIGWKAGEATEGGVYNVFIGNECRGTHPSHSQAIAIGSNIDAAPGQVAFGTSGLGKVYNEFDTDAAWSQGSDVRLKQNINDSTLGLDFINNLRPVTYNWKPNNELPEEFPLYQEENQKDTEILMTGLIAQEVKEAIDESGVERFGGWDTDNDGIQQIKKELFVFPLIKALQEADDKIDALTARIEELEG